MAEKLKTSNLIIFLVSILILAQIAAALLFIFFVRFDTLAIFLFSVIQIFFIAACFLLSIINKRNLKLKEKARESDAIGEQREFDLQYYELIKSHRQEIATMRHEIANGLQVAMSLLKSQAVEDKRKGAALLVDIGLQNSVRNDVIYCNNSIINTIVVVKAKIAKGLSIRTKLEISASDDIAISKLDLCQVFGNLLDNAIEAAKKAEDKYIELKAGDIAGFFVIKVKNSKTNDIKKVNGEIITSKDDQERHGKGLKILKRIAQKYDGKLSMDYDEQSFTAVVTLKL